MDGDSQPAPRPVKPQAMRGKLTFRQQLALEEAVAAALSPLASRTSRTSAARLRAAIRWGVASEEAPAMSRFALAGRAAESFAAFFAGALLFISITGTDAREVSVPSVID